MQKDFLEELDNELSWGTPIEKTTVELPVEETKQQPVEGVASTKEPSMKEVPVKEASTPKEKNKPFWGKKFAHENKKEGNETSDADDNTQFLSLKQTMMSNFPEVKFYLPSIRPGYTRFIPIWGNNETGAKNMNMFQYWDDILLIDCGIQFAEPDMLGANCSIPDISFLIPYKKNIKGFVITHAHLDHIGALKYILPALDFPTIYGTKLTIGIIKKGLEENKLLHLQKFVEVSTDNNELIPIGEHFKCEFFRVNHSVPDCSGVYVTTPGGFKAVHTWDFKIDFAPEIDKPADLSRIGEYGRKWVTLFLSDSTGSTRKGFSTSEKHIGDTLEKIIAQHSKGRLIITIFSSWISRVQQIINACESNDKYVFLSGRSMVENVAISKELWYLKAKPGTIKKMSPKTTEWIPLEKQVIITTGSQWEEFSALSRMAEGKHASIEIMAGDTIIFSSSVVPGNERSVIWVINKLIRLGANVITKDDGEVHTGWHAFQEEQKIMLNLVQPKYFLPIYGDLYFRHVHKLTAMSMGMKEENVLLLDNGNIVDFGPDQKVFKSKLKAPIQDIIIDGHWIGTATSHVIQAREKMMNAWVLVLLFKVDAKSKAILGPLKVESRGLVYLDEVRIVHKIIIKKAKAIYENTLKDVPEIEEKDLVKIIKSDLEAFLLQKIDRSPMVVPMIMDV